MRECWLQLLSISHTDCRKSSNILSGISSDILSDILCESPDILSGISSRDPKSFSFKNTFFGTPQKRIPSCQVTGEGCWILCQPHLLLVLLVLLFLLLVASSTAPICAQCSLPDHPLVFATGPEPRSSTASVSCRTPTAIIRGPLFPAGPQPRPSAASVPCRTSTARQKICQIERQKKCQKFSFQITVVWALKVVVRNTSVFFIRHEGDEVRKILHCPDVIAFLAERLAERRGGKSKMLI